MRSEYHKQEESKEKSKNRNMVYMTIARIIVRSPCIIPENDWHFPFTSFEEAVAGLSTLSLKQPVRIYRKKFDKIETIRRTYNVWYFYARPELDPTDLKIRAEVVEWIPYRELKAEVNNLTEEVFGIRTWNLNAVDYAISNKRKMYEVIKVRYKDKYEKWGEVWVLRRFKKETLQKRGDSLEKRRKKKYIKR